MAPVAKGTGIVDDTKGRGRHFLRNVQSNKAGRGEKISISIVSWVNLNWGGTVGRDEHDVAGVRLYDHVQLSIVIIGFEVDEGFHYLIVRMEQAHRQRKHEPKQ
jgi:hypothetical protein